MWESHDLMAKWVVLIVSGGILCLVLLTPCISQAPGNKGATYLCLGFRQYRGVRCAHGSWDEILGSSSPILAWFTWRHVCWIENISLKLVKNTTITIAAETHCILSSDTLVPTCMLSCFNHVRLCNPMYWSPPGSSVLGILQARLLEWVAIIVSQKVQEGGEHMCTYG